MSAKGAPKNNEHKIVLKVVVQGNGVDIESNVNQPLKSLIGKALADAGVAGGTDNWYFSDESGNELNAENTIAALGLVAGQTILLNQRAGAAG